MNTGGAMIGANTHPGIEKVVWISLVYDLAGARGPSKAEATNVDLTSAATPPRLL